MKTDIHSTLHSRRTVCYATKYPFLRFLFLGSWSLVIGAYFSFAAHAAIPELLTYQGILKDNAGNLLTGTYSMTFRIYDAQTGGSALWTETQSSVSVSSGKFSVQLGTVTALNLDFSTDYWLSIQVGTDPEMSPRTRLTSAGYAYRSGIANQAVDGLTQTAHAEDSHMNITGVKAAHANIAKTNFKLDSYTKASANNMGDLIVDTFNDATGIHAASSTGYEWRGNPNYDVIRSGGGIDSYTVLLPHMNGSDGATTFTDSSNSPKPLTAHGDAQIDTAQSKFGDASGLFDGAGDYLTIPDHNDWDFRTGDFTIDFWMRANAFSGDPAIVTVGNYTTGVSVVHYGEIIVYVKSTSYFNTKHTLSTGVWYHLAVVRTGNTLKVFVNGTQVGSNYDVTGRDISGLTEGVWIGYRPNHNRYYNGWLDELRISKGIARWTSNFTPPANEYTLPPGSATVTSISWTEPSAPKEAMIIADETLNTGTITYSISRDNGTTWTVCAKDTLCNISSQPSGTQVRWKAVITGDAELEAIAVAV